MDEVAERPCIVDEMNDGLLAQQAGERTTHKLLAEQKRQQVKLEPAHAALLLVDYARPACGCVAVAA